MTAMRAAAYTLVVMRRQFFLALVRALGACSLIGTAWSLFQGLPVLVACWREQCMWVNPVLLALFFGFLALTVVFFLGAVLWDWYRNRKPETKFARLVDRLEHTRSGIKGLRLGDDEDCWVEVHGIWTELTKLDIPCPAPRFPINRKNWAGFLAWIVVYARRGELDDARWVKAKHHF